MEPAPPNGEPPEETSPESSEPIEPSIEPKPSPPTPKGFPVTFSGVASFAETGWGRLLGWQFLMALALGGAVLLVLARHWAPVVDSAMQQLPAETGWRNGALVWPDDKPVELGRNNYFCLIVDPAGTARQGQLADVQIELRRDDWLLGSVFGYFELNYAPGDLPLMREELAPWWGARRPFLLLALGVAGLACAGSGGWRGGAFGGILRGPPMPHRRRLETRGGGSTASSAAAFGRHSVLRAGIVAVDGVAGAGAVGGLGGVGVSIFRALLPTAHRSERGQPIRRRGGRNGR
jgi:hypothetical protein